MSDNLPVSNKQLDKLIAQINEQSLVQLPRLCEEEVQDLLARSQAFKALGKREENLGFHDKNQGIFAAQYYDGQENKILILRISILCSGFIIGMRKNSLHAIQAITKAQIVSEYSYVKELLSDDNNSPNIRDFIISGPLPRVLHACQIIVQAARTYQSLVYGLMHERIVCKDMYIMDVPFTYKPPPPRDMQRAVRTFPRHPQIEESWIGNIQGLYHQDQMHFNFNSLEERPAFQQPYIVTSVPFQTSQTQPQFFPPHPSTSNHWNQPMPQPLPILPPPSLSILDPHYQHYFPQIYYPLPAPFALPQGHIPPLHPYPYNQLCQLCSKCKGNIEHQVENTQQDIAAPMQHTEPVEQYQRPFNDCMQRFNKVGEDDSPRSPITNIAQQDRQTLLAVPRC